MTLKDWLDSSWLIEHETTAEEMASSIALADRDIHDARINKLSEDWQFNIAYNAALQLSTAALTASGYRVNRGSSHHHYAIQSLKYTIAVDTKTIRLFDGFRKKRNVAEYDSVGMISAQEAAEMLKLAVQLRQKLMDWLKKNHPDLLLS